jgi:glycosyltransferase involved in cell wall biosynthesis
VRRLAVLSPLPPAPTGIADYTADVLAFLAQSHSVDAFHDQKEVDATRLPRSVSIYPAQEFLRRHAREPYDLAVYQMGNGAAHAFLYPHLVRVPGLLVLHDLVLHHSRAQMFLDSAEARAYAKDPSSAALRRAALEPLRSYEAEVARSYPAQGRRLAETHLGTVGTLLPYAYPLFRVPVEASRLTLVHNGFMERAIREEIRGAEVAVAPMPVSHAPVKRGDVAALREHLGFAPGDLVVGSFGLLTPEKEIDTVARAVARTAAALPRVRLLLVGPVPDRGALEGILEARGVKDRTTLTGRVPLETLATHVEASDVVVHLRYPTARETSAALLRVLAQGRPTVISDLENLAEIPEDAALRADLTDEEGAVTRALLRLGERPDLRSSLGARAAEFVREHHAPEKSRKAYEAAIERARSLPDPPGQSLAF